MKKTVYLNDRLDARLRELVPPRKLNRFINDVLEEKANQLEVQRLEEDMRAGYIASNNDQADLAKDWSVVDVEDWPA